jgi:hypothetical protein
MALPRSRTRSGVTTEMLMDGSEEPRPLSTGVQVLGRPRGIRHAPGPTLTRGSHRTRTLRYATPLGSGLHHSEAREGWRGCRRSGAPWRSRVRQRATSLSQCKPDRALPGTVFGSVGDACQTRPGQGPSARAADGTLVAAAAETEGVDRQVDARTLLVERRGGSLLAPRGRRRQAGWDAVPARTSTSPATLGASARPPLTFGSNMSPWPTCASLQCEPLKGRESSAVSAQSPLLTPA